MVQAQRFAWVKYALVMAVLAAVLVGVVLADQAGLLPEWAHLDGHARLSMPHRI